VGLDKREQAEYTPRELDVLKLGWALRNQPPDDRSSRSGRLADRKRELAAGHQQERDRLLEDLGFE
jgi:hypothetical protein